MAGEWGGGGEVGDGLIERELRSEGREGWDVGRSG